MAAYKFLNIINKTETINMIKEVYYINERRWNVKLYNNILIIDIDPYYYYYYYYYYLLYHISNNNDTKGNNTKRTN